MPTGKQNSDKHHQESSIKIQHCSLFLRNMDIYGIVLAYFEGRRFKYRLRFMLDKKEISLTLDDFRTFFHLPQANDNNHNSFMPPPSFSDMVQFYKQQLGFTMELKTSSSFKTTGLLQPWQTLCKIFSKLCGASMGRNLLFTFITQLFDSISQIYKNHRIVYYMTNFPETQDVLETCNYKLQDDDKIEKFFNKEETKIKLAFKFADRRSMKRWKPRSNYKRSRRARSERNVKLVTSTLESEEIEKLVEGSENVIDDSLSPRNDEPQILGTRLEPRSDKESPEVERTNDAEVEVIKVVILVNVNEEEDEITDEVYELKRREKGNIVEESRSRPLPTPIRSLRTHTNLVSSDTEKL
ncbi:hypothetical protein Tco_1073334 [Tanacetum coccineum]